MLVKIFEFTKSKKKKFFFIKKKIKKFTYVRILTLFYIEICKISHLYIFNKLQLNIVNKKIFIFYNCNIS